MGWAAGTVWGIIGAAVTPVGALTMAHALLVGHRGSGSNPRSPIGTLCSNHCSSRDFGGSAK